MLTEWVQYQGKAGFLKRIFKMVFLEILSSVNWAGFRSDSHIFLPCMQLRSYNTYGENFLHLLFLHNDPVPQKLPPSPVAIILYWIYVHDQSYKVHENNIAS